MDDQRLTTLGNRVPDYTGDRYWAKILATKIQKFWADKGHTDVRVWVEADDRDGGRKIWNIRSNIKYSVPQ